MVILLLLAMLYDWAPPFKITPDSAPVSSGNPQLLISDNQGKVWFTWLEDHWPNRWFVLARFFEGGTLSPPDTVMPECLVMSLKGLTRDRNGNVWVLGDDDSNIWTKYYNGSQWSDSLEVPTFPAVNTGSVSGSDSMGNYWVAWSTDYFGLLSIYSCYYDGNSWSPRYQVSNKPGEAVACGMATASTGILWLVWTCLNGNPDSMYISTFNGTGWSEAINIDGGLDVSRYPPAFMEASIVDSSIFVSYRKSNGTIYVLRFISDSQQPETLWVNDVFERAPSLVCDNLGQLWLFLLDSLSQHEYRLYYAIWDGDSVSTPVFVDTFNAYDGRAIYEPSLQRIWVSYKDSPIGNPAIYATYTSLEGINEKRSVIYQRNFSFVCKPNIIRNEATIKFVIPRKTDITLTLHDITGKTVRKIFDGEKTEGAYCKKISLKNHPCGVYFLILKVGNSTITRKLLLIR